MTDSLRSSARRVLAITGAIALIAACAASSIPAHAGASSAQLVYICQQTPCANFKIFPPSTVYRPAVTESWESPAAYDRTFRLPVSCSAPSVWIEPGGIWICAAGRWALRLRL